LSHSDLDPGRPDASSESFASFPGSARRSTRCGADGTADAPALAHLVAGALELIVRSGLSESLPRCGALALVSIRSRWQRSRTRPGPRGPRAHRRAVRSRLGRRDDLVQRNFTAAGPDEVRLTDITEHPPDRPPDAPGSRSL